MSDKPHTPHDPHAPSESVDAVEPIAASVRAAWAEWAELAVPPLPMDFADSVMLEVSAVERAEAWERAFVPALPDDFAARVAALAAHEDRAHEALSAWRDAHVPALPEGFAAAVSDAALADEASREGARREAFVAWSEDCVPALPPDFAATVTDAVMKSAQDELRTSGVIEKSAQLRAVTDEAASASVERARGPQRPRRWVAPAAVSTFAAAAAAVLALTVGPRTITPRPTDPVHSTQRTPVTTPARNAQPAPTVARQTPAQTGTAPGNVTPVNGQLEDEGSEVEKVDVDGDRASFAAFSIQGEDDHSSVAVVWIDDGDKHPSEAPATL